MIKTIKSDLLTVEINSVGAEIKSVKNNDGVEFMWDANPDIWANSAPVMFPICGGLKEDKYIYNGKEYSLTKHGFVRFAPFEVEAESENSVTMLYKSNEETLANYPFEFEFRVIFAVSENSLNVTYSVKNLTDGEMYFSVGCHEAYATPEGIEEYDIVFDKPETLDAYGLDGNLISQNKTRIIDNSDTLALNDDFFKIDALVFMEHKSNACTLCHKNGTRKIKVEYPDFPQLLLWHKYGAKYLCIEPWCGMADIIGSGYDITEKAGILRIDKNADYSVSHKITFSA